MNRHMLWLYLFGGVLTIAAVTKVGYTAALLGERYSVWRRKENTRVGKEWVYLRKHTEFAFLVIMASVMLFLFNPLHPQLGLVRLRWTIDSLFVFGLVLLWSADWSLFQPNESRRVVRHLLVDSWFEEEQD